MIITTARIVTDTLIGMRLDMGFHLDIAEIRAEQKYVLNNEEELEFLTPVTRRQSCNSQVFYMRV